MHFSTAFHPQIDGQSEKTIQTLKDMLRACVLEFKDSLVMHLPLVEFAYNNYQVSIDMALCEAFFGKKCGIPLGWDEVGEWKLEDIKLIEAILENIKII